VTVGATLPDPSIVVRYLTGMSAGDGPSVVALFVDDGVIDDYLGGHRAGRLDIERFMNNRPHRDIDIVGRILVEGRRVTAYTTMSYADGRSVTVRFVFTMRDGLIEHLCNSSIAFVPEEFRCEPRQLVPRAV
jgi:hypothetical protein